MDYYVENPLTGRMIQVGGKTFNSLIGTDVRFDPTTLVEMKPPRRESKGWKQASPKRGCERSKYMMKCGADCFLMPKNKKFPVCDKQTCELDCRGLLSAKNRAREWGYEEVAERADELARELKCKWKMSSK